MFSAVIILFDADRGKEKDWILAKNSNGHYY